MERARQAKLEHTRRHGAHPHTPAVLPTQQDDALRRANRQGYAPAQILTLQQQVGNQATLRQLHREDALQRAVDYNAELNQEGRDIDPELATGVLPFTETGWDGRLIGRKLSQLNPLAPPSDYVRCAQTAFLVTLVQRGPEAVLAMIENYRARYAEKLRSPRTRAPMRALYTQGLETLASIAERIAGKTATYDDLSALQQAMFEEFVGSKGAAAGGSTVEDVRKMVEAEGYTAHTLNLVDIDQPRAAQQAAQLKPGEFLSCAVDNTPMGIYVYNHNIQIGAYPDTGGLYLYDPAPIRGDQLIDLDASLSAMQHYFTNTPEQIQAELAETGGLVVTARSPSQSTGEAAPPTESDQAAVAQVSEEELRTMGKRKFMINARFTPPAAEALE